jgi:NitT/TauT family transport system permease protein
VASWIREAFFPILAGLVLLVLWQGGVRAFGIRRVLLPTPTDILYSFAEQGNLLFGHIWPTVWECVVGFLLSAVVGIGLGILLVYSDLFRKSLFPYVLSFQVMPKVAVAPLFIIWLGIGPESRILTVFFIAFFPIVVNTADGLRRADEKMVLMARAYCATEGQIFRKVRMPCAMPFIFSGLKVSITFAVVGIVVAEFLAAQRGLGYVIIFTQSLLETPLMIATLMVLSLVGMVLYLLVALLEKVFIYWEAET